MAALANQYTALHELTSDLLREKRITGRTPCDSGVDLLTGFMLLGLIVTFRWIILATVGVILLTALFT